MPTEFRRFTAIEKEIKDIDQNDRRVRITGTILSLDENSVMLDDSTSTTQINFDNTPEVSKGDMVRIFALRQGDGLKCEIIQKLGKDFNIELYKKAKKHFDDYNIPA